MARLRETDGLKRRMPLRLGAAGIAPMIAVRRFNATR
jgi:hypothetical protein